MSPNHPAALASRIRRSPLGRQAVATLLVALLVPAMTAAQDLSGSYVFQSPQGPVGLTLLQNALGQVSGRLNGADGTVFQLQGAVREGRATGQVSIGGDTGWFAAGFHGSTLLLVVAEFDPSTGHPDLNRAWNLEFVRVSGGRGTPTPSAPASDATDPASASGVAAGAPDPFGRPDESQLAGEWREMLRGAKLTRISSYSSSTGGGGGYSEHWEAFLCSDLTLHFRDDSVTSYGDVGAYSARQGTTTGRWQILTQGDRAVLATEFHGGPVRYGELTYDPAQRATYLDGKRFYITRTDNHMCG